MQVNNYVVLLGPTQNETSIGVIRGMDSAEAEVEFFRPKGVGIHKLDKLRLATQVEIDSLVTVASTVRVAEPKVAKEYVWHLKPADVTESGLGLVHERTELAIDVEFLGVDGRRNYYKSEDLRPATEDEIKDIIGEEEWEPLKKPEPLVLGKVANVGEPAQNDEDFVDILMEFYPTYLKEGLKSGKTVNQIVALILRERK